MVTLSGLGWLLFGAGVLTLALNWREAAASLFPVDYEKYLKSARWKRKARAARRRAGYRCQDCGQARPPLEVHHKTYARLGYERMSDLVALCGRCHDGRHGR